jgi:HSP20 family molecular chaperone IbpA
MACRRCGFDIEGGWQFCPKCGARVGGDPRDDVGRDMFSQIFNSVKSDFDNGFEDMDKMMDKMMKSMKILDISPFFRPNSKPFTSGGFAIRIQSGSGMEPRISVQTFGSVPKDAVKIMQGHTPRKNQRPPFPVQGPPAAKPMHLPKVIEEPKTDVRNESGKVVVSMDMPGVDSVEDVQICELEGSVEVKAVSKDRAYFKILRKPENTRIAGRSFGRGRLRLEFF